jgi:3-hydroxyisobutyrate dehydrogenase-like beta-hydroxyacid dehydrogenase
LNKTSIERVGVIGLGKMGLPMARHMSATGLTVVGFDPSPAAQAAAAAAGVQIKGSSLEVAQVSDLIIVIVGFDKQIEEVIFGERGILAGAAAGTIIALASTSAPSYVRSLPGRLGDQQVHFIDIPVARGEMAAEAGNLLVFGGGDQTVFERCRPALQAFSEHIFYLGELGCGQVGKAVNNLLLWACLSANVEGLELAEALGVDREALRAALQHSSGDNWALRTRADERPMAWAEKDMMIVLSEADTARIALPVCGTVKEAIKALKIKRNLGMPQA